MHEADGPKSQSRIELGLVEVLNVAGSEVFELPVAQGGLYVVTDHALVALEGRRLDGGPDRAVKPEVQVRGERLILALEDESLVPLTKRLDELLGDILALLAVDGLSLGRSLIWGMRAPSVPRKVSDETGSPRRSPLLAAGPVLLLVEGSLPGQ